MTRPSSSRRSPPAAARVGAGIAAVPRAPEALGADEDTVVEPPNPLALPLRRQLRGGSAPSREVVRRWLRAGFALDGRDAAGATALMRAAEAGALDLVALLVGQGAYVNATDARGYTALAQAALAGHATVAGYLKSRGASPNAAAPLFDAIRRGDAGQVAALLRHGTSAGLRDRAGHTALHCARAHRRHHIARLLRPRQRGRLWRLCVRLAGWLRRGLRCGA